MASISPYWLSVWLWVDWETPTPGIFTVIVAAAVWLFGHTQNSVASSKVNAFVSEGYLFPQPVHRNRDTYSNTWQHTYTHLYTYFKIND